jgi:hypothetical protein
MICGPDRCSTGYVTAAGRRAGEALWAIESNRHLDVCSLCALSLCAKYDFIERYSGFNCVSRHGHMLKISPFLP